MKLKLSFILLVFTFGLFLPERTKEQLRIPQSVLANGGTELTGSANSIVGTVGQPLIGVASGSAHNLNGGFWYTQASAMIVNITSPGTGVGIQPEEYALYNNYPNPFNPSTVIKYALPEASGVSLLIYNINGQEVMRWDESDVSPGYYEKMWNGTTQAGVPVSSGMYIYRIIAGDFVQTRKMLLLK